MAHHRHHHHQGATTGPGLLFPPQKPARVAASALQAQEPVAAGAPGGGLRGDRRGPRARGAVECTQGQAGGSGERRGCLYRPPQRHAALRLHQATHAPPGAGARLYEGGQAVTREAEQWHSKPVRLSKSLLPTLAASVHSHPPSCLLPACGEHPPSAAPAAARACVPPTRTCP